MSDYRRPRGFRRGIILQIRVSVDGDVLGSFKCFHVRRHIDVEKLSINEQKPLGVGQTWELRKIIRFDFRQT